MEKINILITSVGRRVSLVKSFQEEIKNLKLSSKIFCTDLDPNLSSACQVVDKSFKVKEVTDSEYITELIFLCNENKVKLIIPTIDTELLVLARQADEFKKNGITILVSDLSFIEKCRDKRKIHDFFDSIKFKRALEYSKSEISFPVFIKPFDGSRSQGILLINNKRDLTEEILANPRNMFLEYFSPNKYKEFTVDIYFNKNSEIISVVPRQRIFVRDGEVNKSCVRKNSIIGFVKSKFENIKGLKGCITLQVFKHNFNDEIIGIEINPRFGGGYPLSYLAGANFPKWILKEYILDKKVEQYCEGWKDNTLMLRYDSEIIVHEYKG